MTFDEWWTAAVLEWEIPMNVSFYPFVKMATSAAWKAGYRVGSMDTTKFMTRARKEEEGETEP